MRRHLQGEELPVMSCRVVTLAAFHHRLLRDELDDGADWIDPAAWRVGDLERREKWPSRLAMKKPRTPVMVCRLVKSAAVTWMSWPGRPDSRERAWRPLATPLAAGTRMRPTADDQRRTPDPDGAACGAPHEGTGPSRSVTGWFGGRCGEEAISLIGFV